MKDVCIQRREEICSLQAKMDGNNLPQNDTAPDCKTCCMETQCNLLDADAYEALQNKYNAIDIMCQNDEKKKMEFRKQVDDLCNEMYELVPGALKKNYLALSCQDRKAKTKKYKILATTKSIATQCDLLDGDAYETLQVKYGKLKVVCLSRKEELSALRMMQY